MNPEMPLPAFLVCSGISSLKKLQWKTTMENTSPKTAPAAAVLLNANPAISEIASATGYNLPLQQKNILQKNTKTAFAGNACWNLITSKFYLKKNLVQVRID